MNIPVSSLFGLIFQWDLTAILLLAVSGMIAITVWLWKKQYRFTPLIGIWLLFLLILSIGIWQVGNQEPFCLKPVENMLDGKTNSFTSATSIAEIAKAEISDEIANEISDEIADIHADQWNQWNQKIRWGTLLFLILVLALYLSAVYFIAALYHTVKRLTETNRELVNAKKSANTAAKIKNDFLANMNHDIRTPMNAIIGFTDIFVQRALQSGYVEEWAGFNGILEIIQKSSSDLLTIINDFLDFSQIEANLLQIESVPMSIKQLIEEIGQLESPKAVEKNLKFSIRYSESIPELILGDPVRLRQILLNLTDNAIKFTSKGKIEIYCEILQNSSSGSPTGLHTIKINGHQTYPEATILKISILDTGIGISPKQIEYLFQPFAVDYSLTREFGGTGLGLSIAKRLAQLMDGNITVKSEPNVGSVFTLMLHVYLPSKEESSIFMEKSRSQSNKDSFEGLESESRTELDSDVYGQIEPVVSDKGLQQPLKNVRVLLVEDMLINQLVISTQLRNAGAKVEVADNGELGIRKITQNIDNGLFFDVILMDMQMPVKDGYEATAQLRSQGYNRPIIAVTAHALTGDREKTIEAGCNDYISKPVERKILIETIKKCLKSKK